MFRFLKTTAAAIALTALAQPGLAGDTHPFPIVEESVDVAYGDLNLDTPADARLMLERIRHAARQACGIMPERDRFYRSNPEFVDKAFATCQRQAIREAVAKLNKTTVAAAYAEAYGMPQTGQPALGRLARSQPNH
jgi:UrcA family protein